MKFYDAKVSFAAGELSPLLYARVDLAQYAIGARKLRNFLVLPQGGVINRPGTSRVGNHNYTSLRLVPFVFSEADSCCLVFSEGFVDVYRQNGSVFRVGGSPYGAVDLPGLRWVQSADVIYLFHQSHPVHTLSRHGDNDWRFEVVEFKNGPFQDMNTHEECEMRMLFGSVDATCPVFTPGMVGRLLKLEYRVKSFSEDLEITAGEDWVLVRNVFGPFTWRTSGRWNGTVEVQRCPLEGWEGKDNESDWEWEDFKTYTSEPGAEENFAFSGDVEEYSTHFRFKKLEGGSSKVKIAVNYDGGMVQRILKITGFWSPKAVYVSVEDKKGGWVPYTDAWALGSFGGDAGYPALGTFHQERLVLANTPLEKQTLWMSRPASWHDFGTSLPAKDDDALTVTLASKRVNEIRGLASRRDLLIFTSGGEWNARAGARSDVFTPSSLVITPSGYQGSATIPPLDVGGATIFLRQHGESVQALGYDFSVDGYTTSDLSLLSNHLFANNPVKAWDYQQSPWSVLWCVLKSGQVAALTLQQEHQVRGWSLHDFSGQVDDVCCIPGAGQDDLYLGVRREGALRVEKLHHRVAQSGQGIFKDGGQYPVTSVLETLEWEQQLQGTLQGRHRHIPVVTLRLYQTAMLKAGVVTENNALLDEAPLVGNFLSEDVRMELPGGVGRTCRVRLENDHDGPVAILGVFPEVVVHEG